MSDPNSTDNTRNHRFSKERLYARLGKRPELDYRLKGMVGA
jgi:hypothetical protein